MQMRKMILKLGVLLLPFIGSIQPAHAIGSIYNLGQWNCSATPLGRVISHSFIGGTDQFKVYDCSCTGDASKDRTGTPPSPGPSYENIDLLGDCRTNTPAAIPFWDPGSRPTGPGPQLCNDPTISTGICTGSNPNTACYSWWFSPDGVANWSECSENTTCGEFAVNYRKPIEYGSGSSNYRKCNSAPTPLVTAKITLSNHHVSPAKNYTLGISGPSGDELVIGSGGGLDNSPTPVPVPFVPSLRLSQNGDLSTKGLSASKITTNGSLTATGGATIGGPDLNMGPGTNIVMHGGRIKGTGPVAIQIFTKTFTCSGDPFSWSGDLNDALGPPPSPSGATMSGRGYSGLTSCTAFLQFIGNWWPRETIGIARCGATPSGVGDFRAQAQVGGMCSSPHNVSINCVLICW